MTRFAINAILTSAFLVGCGGGTEVAAPAKAGDDANAPGTASDAAPDAGSKETLDLPSASWTPTGNEISARTDEISRWYETNEIDPVKDDAKIQAMKLAVADKSVPPPWVAKGSWAEEETRTLFGVGAVSGLSNQSLALITAENRGRAELAKMFQVTIQRIEIQDSTAIKTISVMTLTGVQIVDWYRDETTNTTYALVAKTRGPE